MRALGAGVVYGQQSPHAATEFDHSIELDFSHNHAHTMGMDQKD